MNIYSAFSGSDIAYLILQELGVKINNYYSSEIDKNAIEISKKNFPDIFHLGDINKIDINSFEKIDLMLAGSPCQGFSRNGLGLNFEDPRSKLFFTWNEQRLKLKPKYFFLENVQMKYEWEKVITDTLEVCPIKTDAGDFSAQKRPRIFWTNIPQIQSKKNNIVLKDILEQAPETKELSKDEKSLFEFLDDGNLKVRNATKKGFLVAEDGDSINLSFPNSKTRRGRVGKQKANTLDRQCNQAVFVGGQVRRFSLVELERLQGYPDGFTDGVSHSARKSIIGNGWNKEQVKDLIKGLAI